MPASDRPLLHREAIIAAARELIVADGLEALSLRRLAARLGVTAPALYAHVRDKQDLLRAVAQGNRHRGTGLLGISAALLGRQHPIGVAGCRTRPGGAAITWSSSPVPMDGRGRARTSVIRRDR